MNCAECAIYADALLAGRGAQTARAWENATEVFQVEKILGGTFGPSMGSIAPITERALSMGPGARGIVFGLPPVGGKVGHYFNVVNQNGVIRFLDAQAGTAADLSKWPGYRVLWTTP